MDNFVVSARKYRPQKFEDVVGQQSIANTLKMAIKNHKLASAYLFCGPRGVGKTTCARIFAKAINCLNPHDDGEACEECDSCRSFNEQRSVNIQELNAAANNSVDDIRDIIDQVRIPPQLGKYKVIILDEVHMLSQSAGNALLKTLEEPPSYVIFILATTEKQKIMQTILSRCQIFDFNRMEISDIVGNLRHIAASEAITVTDEALNIIAQKADGGMRDALSIFDQVSNFSQGNITADSVLQCINALDSDYYFRMTDLLLEHNVVESMVLFNDIVNKGFNGGVFIGGLASHMRDLLMSRDTATLPLLNVADSVRQRYMEQAARCSVKFLYFAIRICDRCSNEYRTSYNKRLSVEIALIETAQFDDEDSAGAGLGPAKILKPIFSAQPALKERRVPRQQPSQPAAHDKPASPAHQPADADRQSVAVKDHAVPPQSKKTLKIGEGLSLKEALAKARAANMQVNTPAPQPQPQPDAAPQQPADSNVQTAAPADSDDTATDSFIADDEQQPSTIFFNDETIQEKWKAFCTELTKHDTVMASRMMGMPVRRNDDNTLLITVHNETVQKNLLPFIADIERYMQQEFGNPSIKAETYILPPEIIKVITNPTELLKKLRGDNPYFSKIVEELDLQLS